MKILQLNTWTGRIKGALPDFIKNNNFDIVCLQETVWSDNSDLLEHFSVTLDQIKADSNFAYESRAANWGIKAFDSIINEGIAILSRYPIIDEKIETVHGEYRIATTSEELRNHCYKVQIIKLENGLNIVNHHGYWKPDPIGDKTTVQVMKKVANLIRNIDGPIIMCGDLNIIHESPAMQELDFLTDLTNEYHIDNTLVGLKFNGKVACDHILVSDQINVKSFIVSDQIVSDHKALIAEIDLNSKE